MNVPTFTINGTKEDDIELPLVFSTLFRKDLISKSFTHLTSHKFQPQGTHPTAGMDVVARSNDPPTGQGRSRIAKMRGGGGGRQGQAGGVASVRGGRQAHPPKVQKVIFKKLNKKENVNKEAVQLYFALGVIPSPWTIYNNTFKLEAAHNLVLDLKI